MILCQNVWLKAKFNIAWDERNEVEHNPSNRSNQNPLAESQIQNQYDNIGLFWMFRPEKPNELLSLMSNEMDEVGLQPTSL